MSIQAVVTPTGRLIIEPVDDSEFAAVAMDAPFVQELQLAFDESAPLGLLLLVSVEDRVQLSVGFTFWKEFAQRVLHRLCSFDEHELQRISAAPAISRGRKQQSSAVAPPGNDLLAGLMDSVPPMKGLEYLSVEVLGGLWAELSDYALQQAAGNKDGPAAWLRNVNPLWNLLGRVTFHLAENKREPQRPFAFLATYAHRVSANAKLRHLPLAEALKQYAGSRDQQTLAALLKPVQRAAQNIALVREMLDSRKLFQPHALSVSQAHRFLTNVPAMEDAGLIVRVPDWWKARTSVSRPEVRVRIGQQQASQLGMDSLMDFSIDLALDGEPLTAEERDQILRATDGLALLRGKWIEVDREKLREALDHWQHVEQQYSDGLDFIQGMRMLAGVRLGKDEADEETADWTKVTAGEWLSDTLQQLREPSGIPNCEPGRDLNATLRPYQADGVRWLWFMTRLGLGACLADDMGLGKTIQVIDLLLTLKAENTRRPRGQRNATSGRKVTTAPSLLIVPASLVGNWKSEFERFAASLNVLYAHRSETDAAVLESIARAPDQALQGYDAVVTTYGLARRFDWLAKCHWRLIVLDEAQAIKNATSAQARAVRKLRSSGRIALSGTPVENHLGELWSLFDFCCPGLLGNMSQFKHFVKQQSAGAGGALRKLVRPYILRRMKTDPGIVPDLPDKTEIRADCRLSKKQVALYQKTLKDLEKRLESADGMERRGMVLTTLMQLKQICNHPSQFLGVDDYPEKDSGKFERLQQICGFVRDRQERVLVFTQFQGITEPLAEFLTQVFGRTGLVLHGGVPVRKRQQLVAEFQADDGPPFFVISVKAGGTGLNLTAASHVVHFDRWWNPAVENQATDRAFRIGQKRNVLVHKFVCRGTVEERIDEMIHAKQSLADEILSTGVETKLTEMDDRELLAFVSIDLTRAGGHD